MIGIEEWNRNENTGVSMPYGYRSVRKK